MMRIMAVCGLVLTVLFGTAWAEELRVLRTAGQESTVPKYQLVNGKATGLCPDILAAITKADPGLRFAGEGTVWSLPQIEHGLENGRFDVFCGLVKLPRRERFATFIETPLYTIRHRVAVRADDTVQVADLDALAQQSQQGAVIATAGISFVEMLRQHGVAVDDGASDNRVNLRKLIGGRGRFFYHNELVLNTLIREQKVASQVRLLPTVFGEEAQQLVVAKQVDPAMLARLSAVVLSLRQSGELDRIYNRYLTR
ncbi:substrate-binding periplasmic protein [Chitinimonas naiadis]